MTVDTSGNLVLSQGLILGNSSLTQAGALRFNNSQVEFNNGSDWVGLSSGGGGAFQPIGATGAVAYNGGNVGIGTFPATGPTYRLEVILDSGTSNSSRVRFGAATIFGSGNEAFFAHSGVANLETGFGFRQEQNGRVRINAPLGQNIRFDQGGNTPRLAISANGNVIVGLDRELPGRTELFQVNGAAVKAAPGEVWLVASDQRVKDDIQDFEKGLETVLQIHPVRFSYNGKAGTLKGEAGVGIIGQEMETILPETISHAAPVDDLGSDDPLRIYNGSALIYVLVNAVKDLAAQVQQLQADLAEVRQEQADS
ncbi:MAG: tail fiber domain-containing protein [Leptolyngbyaceae cyanobacterium SM2_5_2]|nr:tail fiber domain-containing protein [Leptolyngbyaceae cyanobacterium SM2_5_2]